MCLVLVCHVLGGHCGICMNVKLNIAKITETTVSVLGICRVNLKKKYTKLFGRKKDIGGCLGLKKRTEKNENKGDQRTV